LTFDTNGNTKARTLDRCAYRRFHFWNKKTFLSRVCVPHLASNVRWWISASTRPDIFTLKSFDRRDTSDQACWLDTTQLSTMLLKFSIISSLYILCYFFNFYVCCTRRLHNTSFFYRLFLCYIQQLGQTSRWHFYISWFS